MYGGNVVAVDGNYDDVNRLCAELADAHAWAFVNVNVRPFYAEGSKTIAFETAEQLGWQTPDHVVVPIGSGSLLTKVRKGFEELHKVGLLDEEPEVRVSGAQATGCSPVATAFTEQSDTIRPVKPATIAKSLAIGNPADGYYALDTIRVDRRRGRRPSPTTRSSTASGCSPAPRASSARPPPASRSRRWRQLAADGVVRPDERVVAYVTGHGLKTLDALGADGGPTATIPPTLDAFLAAFPELRSED